MSENLDLVRSIYADWERGDWSGGAEWAHPDIEFAFTYELAPGSSKGLAGMADAWRGWLSAWEDVRFQATEFRELDDQRVLVLGDYSGSAKTSGMDMAPIASQVVAVYHVIEGKVTKLILYPDLDRALADLGLAPEDDSA
jgi:ketosteroid isomerase-like protein